MSRPYCIYCQLLCVLLILFGSVVVLSRFYKSFPASGIRSDSLKRAHTKIRVKCRDYGMAHRPPVTRFMYHALHKTGSTATREVLRQFCTDHNISCLTYSFCQHHYSNPNNLFQCHLDVDNVTDAGTLTSSRLTACCPGFASAKFDAIVEHLAFDDSELTRGLLSRHVVNPSGLFNFTIMRHPVTQFISYYHQAKQSGLIAGSFEDVVLRFYHHTIGRNRISTAITKSAFDLLTNSQSKELLNWQGTPQDLLPIKVYLSQLNFVGIYERLGHTWKQLGKALSWDKHTYFADRKVIRIGRHYPPQLMRMISRIQWADRRLYSIATRIFRSCSCDNSE